MLYLYHIIVLYPILSDLPLMLHDPKTLEILTKMLLTTLDEILDMSIVLAIHSYQFRPQSMCMINPSLKIPPSGTPLGQKYQL